MGLLAPPSLTTELTPRQRTEERLHYWRQHLLEHKAGTGNACLTLPEIRKQLDRLLDLLLDELSTTEPASRALAPIEPSAVA